MDKIWQRYYAKGVPANVSFEEISLPDSLTRSASRYGSRPALIFQGTEVTFKELDEMVSRFASALARLGVRPGDRVSFVLPNLIQTVVGIYGALRAGAVVVMHNPRLDDLQFEFQFKDAGSKILVCLDILTPRLLNVQKRTKIQKLVSCHIRDYLPGLKKKLFAFVKPNLHLNTPTGSGILEFTEIAAGGDPSFRGHAREMDETAFLLYTSATTGKAKGVDLSHRNMSYNVQQAKAWFPQFRDGHESVVGCLPFFHSFGLTTALNIGIMYGFSDILVPLPEPANILEAIGTYKPTYVPALPTFYNAVINDPALAKHNIKSLKGCFSGGAPLPLATIRTFERITGAQICEGYGSTETSPVTHINPLGGKTKVGTIGLPLPNTEAKIVAPDNPDREITQPGVPGELAVRGPQVMRGYLNLPQQSEAALRFGWYLTGDIATVDQDGYFTIVDRKRDLIASDVEKVFPRDVEEVLYAHPKVSDACTIGIPDPEKGEVIKAFVVLKKGETVSGAEIISFCSKKLAPHQVPARVEFMDELPRSPVGKVLRKELRRMHLVRGITGGGGKTR